MKLFICLQAATNASLSEVSLQERFKALLHYCGWSGQAIIILTTAALMASLLFSRRPSLCIRAGLSLLAVHPVILGMAGTAHILMKAFTETGPGVFNHGQMLLLVLSQASRPLMLGLYCSALLLAVMAVLWLRPLPAPQPPTAKSLL